MEIWIKMKTTAAGPRGVMQAGMTALVDEYQAVELVSAGYASYMPGEKEPPIMPKKKDIEPDPELDVIETAEAAPVDAEVADAPRAKTKKTKRKKKAKAAPNKDA